MVLFLVHFPRIHPSYSPIRIPDTRACLSDYPFYCILPPTSQPFAHPFPSLAYHLFDDALVVGEVSFQFPLQRFLVRVWREVELLHVTAGCFHFVHRQQARGGVDKEPLELRDVGVPGAVLVALLGKLAGRLQTLWQINVRIITRETTQCGPGSQLVDPSRDKNGSRGLRRGPGFLSQSTRTVLLQP